MLLRISILCLAFVGAGIARAEVAYRSAAQMGLGGSMWAYNYDINGDGAIDLVGSFESIITADVPTSGGGNFSTFKGSSGFQFLRSSDPFGFSLLEAGDVVGPQSVSGSWSSSSTQPLGFAYHWNRFNPENNGYAGLDDTVREAWIGFYLMVDDKKYYGVLHFDLYMPGIEPGTEIAGYPSLLGAYIQTTPGKPLVFDNSFAPVPEPGSVGLIAAGVGVLLSFQAFRRKA